MTHHLSSNETAAPQQPSAQALAERVAALELFLQQLVFVLDAQGAMNADALTRWISLARSRMLMTGSVPASEVAALTRLLQQVQE